MVGADRTSAVTGPADAVRTRNFTRHSVATFRFRATGSPSPSEDTFSLAPSAVTGRVAGRQLARRGGALFATVPLSKHAVASPRGVASSDPKNLRRCEVSIDIGMLARVPAARATALPLNLFDGVILAGVIERRTPTYSGGYALPGRLAGVAGGTVTLVVNGSVVAGAVRFPGSVYRMQPAGVGRHTIIQINPSQFPLRCRTEERQR